MANKPTGPKNNSLGNPPKPIPSRSDPKPPPQGWVPKPPPQSQAPIKSAKEKIGSKAKAFKVNVPANKQSQDVKKPSGAKVFNKSAQNKAAFAKGMKAAKANKGKAAGDPTLMNPLSGRTKASSKAKHAANQFPTKTHRETWAKELGKGPKYQKPASKPAPVMQKQQPSKPSSPSFASKAGSAIKSGAKGVYGAVTSPTAKGLAQAAFTHAGMAVMHGSNYPQKMHEYASRGPREFRPGWHGFTSPVERPKAEEGTDTKGERA